MLSMEFIPDAAFMKKIIPEYKAITAKQLKNYQSKTEGSAMSKSKDRPAKEKKKPKKAGKKFTAKIKK